MDRAAIVTYLYSSPSLAAVGLTETLARARKLKYRSAIVPLASLPLVYGDAAGFLKVIVGGRGQLLGATAVAPDAAELLTPLALFLDQPVGEILALPTSYLSSSELIRHALIMLQ